MTGQSGGCAPVVTLTPLVEGAPLTCAECGLQVVWGSVAACVMWPKGCRTVRGDRLPSVCWWCCDEDQRVDLIEAGCDTAVRYVRYGTPPRPPAGWDSGPDVPGEPLAFPG